MKSKKGLAAAAMTAALGAGGVVGAISGTPFSSGAQDTTTTAPSNESASSGTTSGKDSSRLKGIRGLKLDAAAEAIGISEEDLKAALKEGKTLAEIAEANGVERQVLIDALVAAGNKQLDELRATLPERMAELVDRNNLTERGDRGGRANRGGFRRVSLETAAKTLGMSVEDLRTQLKDGKTLAEVAEAQGVERQTLVDALTAQAIERIDQAVTDEKLTQEQADEAKATLGEKIEKAVDGELGGRRHN